MAKKIKSSKKRPSEKLVAGARDVVLAAYDTAASLLTAKERLDLIASLREDLDLRQSAIEYARDESAQRLIAKGDFGKLRKSDFGKLRIRQEGDRTVITLAGIHTTERSS